MSIFVASLPARAQLSNFFFNQALQAKEEWQLDKALRYLSWSLRLKRDNFPASFEKGICHQLRGDLLASQREFDWLMAQPGTDPALQVELLNAVGVNRFNANDPDAALKLHKQSLDLARKLGNLRLEARVLIDFSRVLYYSKGQLDKSLLQLQQALQLAREVQDELIEADALRNIGVVYWFNNEFDRPLNEYYWPALEIYQRLNDMRGAAITLSNIALIYYQKGDLFQFIRYQRESLQLKERVDDKVGLSDSYLYLGAIYADIENYRKALEYFLKSLELSQQIGYRLGQNEAEHRLAHVYRRLGETDKALDMNKRLLDQVRGSPWLARYRLEELGSCYRLKGDLAAARQHYQEALKLDRMSGTPEIEGELLTNLGETYMDSGDWQKASQYLNQSENLLIPQKERKWWRLLGNRLALERLREHEGRREEALTYLLQAAELESQAFGSTKTDFVRRENWRIYDRLFSMLLERPEKNQPYPGTGEQFRPEEKIAFRLLEQLRYRTFRNLVMQFSDKRPASHPPAQKERAAISQIDRVTGSLNGLTSSGMMEQLGRAYGSYEDLILQAELSRPRYQLIREARPAELEEIHKILDSETALLEYLYAGEEVFALLVTRSTFQSAHLPITRSDLAAKVKLFRALIFNGAETSESGSFDFETRNEVKAPSHPNEAGKAEWRPVAEDLRRRLIGPLEQSGALRSIRRLGVVPFGFLHDLPFAALVRAEGDRVRFLIEDYSIFYPPSATFLKHSNIQTALPDWTMISFGRNESDEEGLPSLAFAAQEARTVAQIFNGQVRVGANASETELKQVASRFEIIHLATHAMSDPMMPLRSRLKLQATTEDDGNLTVHEILDLGLHAELITLGACRTAQSFSSSGNEISEVDRIGLIEAFLYAGAKSVLASLLPIDDRATMEFMKAFYRNLRSKDKAFALAETQRAMLRGELFYAKNNQPHTLTQPHYWAPFVLAGDYR